MSQPLYMVTDELVSQLVSNLSENDFEKLLQLSSESIGSQIHIEGYFPMMICIKVNNWWTPVDSLDTGILYLHKKPLPYRSSAYIAKDRQSQVQKTIAEINAYLAFDVVFCNNLRLFIMN